MRYSLIILLVYVSAGLSLAQEPNVLAPIWAEDILSGVDEKVTIVEVYMDDINNDGYSEACVVTSGTASTRNVKQKNHIHVYGRNGTKLWHYGIDDRVRDVFIYDINTCQIFLTEFWRILIVFESC